MSFSGNSIRKFLFVAVLLILSIISMAIPLSSSQVEASSNQTSQAVDSIFSSIDKLFSYFKNSRQEIELQYAQDPAERAFKVTHIQLCPRHLVLYVGEAHTLVPTPLDQKREPVHGLIWQWETNDPAVASVSSWGEVNALAPGHAIITAIVGSKQAKVALEVRQGARLPISDEQNDAEHANDCTDPEADPLTADNVRQKGDDKIEFAADNSLRKALQPAVFKQSLADKTHIVPVAAKASYKNAATTIKSAKYFFFQSQPIIDGSTADQFSPTAETITNATGAPRFAPMEKGRKTKNNVGNDNYVFTAPVFSLGGRGVNVNLALTYNSRLWNKESNSMTFNYNKGWPAVGWTFGYGRIVRNYNNTSTGDGSGTGLANSPGDHLLIQADGTRIPLKAYYDSTAGVYRHKSSGGVFIYYNPVNGRLQYPDGTLVKYDNINNRLLPASIRSQNGDLITIEYHTFDSSTFPYRWAIKQITDTWGRIIKFRYYGDGSDNPSDTVNKPQNALSSIEVPDATQPTGKRKVVELTYQSLTLSYNFSSTVSPIPSSPIYVMRRIHYPDTGRGYLFLDYSSYGMCRYISERRGIKGSSSDGIETGYTKYNYKTNVASDPDYQGSSSLNDSPSYTSRKEWWEDKTDSSGNPTTSPNEYLYNTVKNSLTITSTVTYPQQQIDGQTFTPQLITVTNNDTGANAEYGTVKSQTFTNGTTELTKTEYTYALFNLAREVQTDTITTTNSAVQTGTPLVSKVKYDYGDYGRVNNVYEYGYPKNGAAAYRRRTEYIYSDTQDHIDAKMLRLVKQVNVYDTNFNTSNGDDILISKTIYNYDIYSTPNWTMVGYGTVPSTHDSVFDTTKTTRGNVTSEEYWINNSGTWSKYSELRRRYDIFGNLVMADVNCCHTKRSSYSLTTFYSQPDSTTDGGGDGATPQQPYLTTTYEYNSDNGLVTKATAPNGLYTTYAYDTAWRLKQVTPPNNPAGSSSTNSTIEVDKDSNDNDLPSATARINYKESDGTTKVITTKSWFDGSGRLLRTGTGSGSSPSSLDMTSAVYDQLGRVLKQYNPYPGDGSGNSTAANLYWTENKYDLLSRLTQADLMSDATGYSRSTLQKISYGSASLSVPPNPESVATVTVTDQVNRQRQSQNDGLGRLLAVTEQDPANGNLSLTTVYTYDLLNNLTNIDQGGQQRTFTYDTLSRLVTQITPEGGTVHFEYNTDGTLNKRTDPLNYETHYGYDALNRPTHIWYSGLNNTSLPSSVAVDDVWFNYNQSGFGIGQINSINVGPTSTSTNTGTEIYTYDSLARVATKSRTIDSATYATSYIYNSMGQLSRLTYPSTKQINVLYDSRGRLNEVNSAGTWQYLNGTTYNNASQLTGFNLNNGGMNEIYGYSSDRLQLTSQQLKRGATTLMDISYNYNAGDEASGFNTDPGNSGQLMGITATLTSPTGTQLGRNESFTYDNLGRLKTANGWGWQRNYTYDRWGNRKAVSGTQSQTVNLQMSGSVPTNQIKNVNSGPDYTYDASGNLTYDGVNSYTYDAANRLVKVNGTTTYTYDFANRRVKKDVSGVVTRYVWEDSQVIAEYSGSGSLQTQYVYAGSRLLAEEPASGGTVKYYHPDRLSTRMITNESNNVLAVQSHDPFGEEIVESGTASKWKFINYERDETGTDYAINRQYATGLGRFMRPDPIQGSIGNPQSLNRYSYVQNDPINFIDPLGLELTLPSISDASIGGNEVRVDGIQAMPEMYGSIFRMIDHGILESSPYWEVQGAFYSGGSWRFQTEPVSFPSQDFSRLRQEFKQFLNLMSDDCLTALKKYLGRLAKQSDTVALYDVDQFNNKPASEFVGPKLGGKDSLGKFFDNTATMFGALAVVRVPKPGIYFRSSQKPFSGDGMYLLLHEMMHTIVTQGKNLDFTLAQELKINRQKTAGGGLESWREAVSRYFNSYCNPEAR